MNPAGWSGGVIARRFAPGSVRRRYGVRPPARRVYLPSRSPRPAKTGAQNDAAVSQKFPGDAAPLSPGHFPQST